MAGADQGPGRERLPALWVDRLTEPAACRWRRDGRGRQVNRCAPCHAVAVDADKPQPFQWSGLFHRLRPQKGMREVHGLGDGTEWPVMKRRPRRDPEGGVMLFLCRPEVLAGLKPALTGAGPALGVAHYRGGLDGSHDLVGASACLRTPSLTASSRRWPGGSRTSRRRRTASSGIIKSDLTAVRLQVGNLDQKVDRFQDCIDALGQ